MKTENDYLQSVSAAIRKADNIIIVGHKGPDFDSAGSCFGLSFMLEQMGKQTLVVAGDLPAKMRHAFGVVSVPAQDKSIESFACDLAIFLDYGAVRMLPQDALEKIQKHNPVFITIDHHRREDQFGDIVWLDDAKSSTAEMLVDLLVYMRSPVSPEAGYCFLLGILSDTGEFVYYLHSERLMPKIQKLNVAGRAFSLAFKTVRSWDTLEQFLLFGKMSARLKVDEDIGFAYVVVRASGELSGLRSFLANQMLFIDNLKCILVLQKVAGGKGYRGSLRSSALESSINVADIASHFIGGGHENAAAFNSRLSSVKIIKTIRQLIREQEKQAGDNRPG